MENAVEIKDLTKVYGNRYVLDHINLTIPRGSFFALLGSNGAGKSTLINIISGLKQKTSGKIAIFGNEISSNSIGYKLRIGTCVQDIMLDPFLTVSEYLYAIAGFYGIPHAKARNKIAEIVEKLSLKEHIHKNTRMLSGGMKRRIIIAKALIHDPDIIILDEPTASIDIELRNQLWEYIKDLNQSGKTILLTTHYLEEAEALSNRIAFINNGKIILNDTKQNILNNILNTRHVILQLNTAQNFNTTILDHLNCRIDILEANLMKITYPMKQVSVMQIIDVIRENKYDILDVSTTNITLDEIFSHIMKTDNCEVMNY